MASCSPSEQASKKSCYCCRRTFALIAEFLKIERSHCKLCNHHVCEFCIQSNKTALCRKCDIIQSTKAKPIQLEQLSDNHINKILYALNVEVKVSQATGREMCLHVIRLYYDNVQPSSMAIGGKGNTRVVTPEESQRTTVSATKEILELQKQEVLNVRKDAVLVSRTEGVQVLSKSQTNFSSSNVQQEVSSEEVQDDVIWKVTDLKKRFENGQAESKNRQGGGTTKSKTKDDEKTIIITKEELGSDRPKLKSSQSERKSYTVKTVTQTTSKSSSSERQEIQIRKTIKSGELSNSEISDKFSQVSPGKAEFLNLWKKMKKDDATYYAENETAADSGSGPETNSSKFRKEHYIVLSSTGVSMSHQLMEIKIKAKEMGIDDAKVESVIQQCVNSSEKREEAVILGEIIDRLALNEDPKPHVVMRRLSLIHI